jgi:molybdopterin-guanine dinucleotide biosynthesis adapter protein
MTPILAIIGRGNSGKTTLLFKIVDELTKRDYKIATIKHTFHKIDFDRPGTDSWKHIEAGSSVTVLSSPDAVFIIKPESKTDDLTRIIEMLGEGYDLIIIEGYKKSDVPKIEVHRNSLGPRLTGITNVIALVTDEPVADTIKQFPTNAFKEIADYIIKTCINSSRSKYSVFINHRSIITADINNKNLEKLVSTITGNSIKINVDEIKDLRLFFKRK